VIETARKAERRLYKKFTRLVMRGKKTTVAATAAARELAGFVWAIGRIEYDTRTPKIMELLRWTRRRGEGTENPRQRYAARRKAKTRVARARQLPTDHCLAVNPAHISMIIDDIAALRPAAKEGG